MNADERDEPVRALSLRMPAEQLAQLRAIAAEHDRSAGAEVRRIVRRHLEARVIDHEAEGRSEARG